MAQGGTPIVKMAYSVSVDATNILISVRIFTRFNIIVGGVLIQHYIYLYGEIDEINNVIH